MGILRRLSSSMRRMIFSTVFGPHEHALTVGSFAITVTGRQFTFPTPVTTASAGRSADSALASRPSSANSAPSSRSSRSRSRTNSFPCSASFWWYFGAPPPRAVSTAEPMRSLSECPRSTLKSVALASAQTAKEGGGGTLQAECLDAEATGNDRWGRDPAFPPACETESEGSVGFPGVGDVDRFVGGADRHGDGVGPSSAADRLGGDVHLWRASRSILDATRGTNAVMPGPALFSLRDGGP